MAVVHKDLNEKLAVNQETLREAVLYKAVNGGFSSLDELNTNYENSAETAAMRPSFWTASASIQRMG